MVDSLRSPGVAAIGGSVVIALVPAVVAAQAGRTEPAEAIPHWLVLGLIMLGPAVIGAIGVARRSRAALVAAAGSCIPVSVLSVATMPIVVPALLFLVAARAAPPASRPTSWLAAMAAAVLAGGSLFALILNTETRCWLAFETAAGMDYRVVSEADAARPLGGPGGPVAAGCDGGEFTARGVLVAAALFGGAVAAAGAASRGRPGSA
ncbi:MAG TPA: hypothetical protein VFR14_08255 [Candidatus Limnocylindrales bacterium]|nr:hypothetical protein [Candidatus Limnocylindrales bacterium]